MRTLISLLVLSGLSLFSPSLAHAQQDESKPNNAAPEAESPAPQSDAIVIGVVAAPECGGRPGAERLGRAVQDRMVDALVLSGPPAGAPLSVDVTWHDGGAGCVARLRAGETDATVELPVDPDDATLDAAAVRIAWLADAYAQSVPSRAAASDTPSSAPTLPEEPPVAEPNFALQRAGVSLVDGVNFPRAEPDDIVRNFSFTVLGSRIGGLRGVELGLLYNRETSFMHGLQMSNAANIVHGPVRGVQFSGAFNYAESVVGLQSAYVNYTRGDVTGAQLGTVNYTRGRVKGLQLGLINVAGTSSASIGLINIMRDEPVYGLAWADSDGTFRLGIEHGSEYFRNILAVGINPIGDVTRWSVGGGFAVHLPVRRLYVQLDVLAFLQGAIGASPTFTVDVTNEQVNVSRLDMLGQARLLLGVDIVNRFAVYTGVAQNLLLTEDQNHDQPWSSAQWSAASDATPGDLGIYLWPNWVLGVRF